MKTSIVLAVALLLTGCFNDPLERQRNLLDQIQTKVTLSFDKAGPVVLPVQGKWESYRLRIFNEFRQSIWVIRVTAKLPEGDNPGNPQNYCYQIECKNGEIWREASELIGSPAEYVEIPAGKSLEFVGMLNLDAPGVGANIVRGNIRVYCDVSDANGRPIISSPLPLSTE